MKRAFALVAVLLALIAAPLNALAATYIQDNASMFSNGAKSQATQTIDNLRRQTGREIVVYTVPSLNGQDAQTAAQNAFRQNNVEGALIFASRDDRRLELVDSPSVRQALPQARLDQIRQTMLDDFRANTPQGFDKGLLDGVNGLRAALVAVPPSSRAPVRQSGPNLVLIGLLVIGALVVVWVIAGIIRARQQPYFSYGQNQPPGAYGQPGYGPGAGWGGGGGGFFSGLMGGLGGALLGNALFDAFRPRDRFYDSGPGYDGGFQNQGLPGDDAGQVGDTSGGSWGDSGGGDSGGGDSGGGDSGGSW